MSQKKKNIFSYTKFLLLLYSFTGLILYLGATRAYIDTTDFSIIRLIILLLFAPIIIKYLIHLIVAPWYPLANHVRSRRHADIATPLVTVLIPAHNEEIGIEATIRSVINANYPRLEVIVMNDGSTDRTHEVVTSFIKNYKRTRTTRDTSLIYRKIKNGGKARALNKALPHAKGEFIITIDADSVMHQNCIRNMIKMFRNPRVASVAGNVVIGNRRKPVGLIQQLEYLYGFYFKRADALLNTVYIVGGAAAAYRKKIIIELGGYDESIITEDIELSTRLQDHGYLVRYAADAIVYTEGPSDFKALYQQRLRWKHGRLLTFYKYRHLFFSRHGDHNKYLAWMILPIAVFSEVLLLFEVILLVVLYYYTFYTNDFTPLIMFMMLLTGVVCLQIISDPNRRYHWNLLLMAPVAWVVFYIMDFVEIQALIRSIRRLVTRKELSWQRWARVGVFEKKVTEKPHLG
jgi:poly-beta-1,6-N-acetyl-D-glucosamine synthase